MANDNKRKLYDALSQDYDMGTYEQFCTDLNDENKRRKLYDATSQEYDYGTWDSFSQQLGYDQPATPVEPEQSEPQYFKLRRGGKDFVVSRDEVNNAGGLTEWAKANPGASLRVYMTGKNDDGSDFMSHVDLADAHDRLTRKGYKYAVTNDATLKDADIQPKSLEQIKSDANNMFAESRERMSNLSDYYLNGNHAPGSQTVEGKPIVNPQTGKIEKTYLTPTGERTTDKKAADKAAYNFRQAMAAADMSVGAQIRRSEAELAELRKQLEDSASRVYNEWKEDYEKNDAPLASVLAANTYVPRQQTDKENSALRVAIRQKEEQLKDLYEERDRQMGKDVGFWRGFGRIAGDIRTWDFGIGDLSNNITMLNADQYMSPDASESEKRAGNAMFKAIYDKQQTEQMYDGNASGWYKAGVMGGYMPKFALDFALMGGADAAPSAMTKAFTAYLGKKMSKVAANKFGRFMIKAVGCMPEDLARGAAMANTIQLGSTAADAIDRKLGDVEFNDDGYYRFENPQSWARAIYQAETNAVIEDYSEMSGKLIEAPLSRLGKKLFNGKTVTSIIAAADKAGLAQIREGANRMLQHVGINGIPGEAGEEYYGQLLRTIVGNDDALDQNGKNNFLSWDFHKDIWAGMALTVPLMGAVPTAISGGRYMHYRHKVNKADKVGSTVFPQDQWEAIRKKIDSATNENIGKSVEAILSQDAMSNDKKAAVMSYAWSVMNLRGFNLSDIAANQHGEADPAEQQIDESYINGYEASTPREMNDAENMYEYQRQRLVNELGSIGENDIETILNDIENDPIGALNKTYDPALRNVVLDYANAKTVRDGMIQRVNDDIDERIAQSDAMIKGRVNQTTGMIQPALMGLEDRQIYVVSGKLAVRPDGRIDRDASDESIIVRDAQTGKLEFADPKSINTVLAEIDPEEEKIIAADNIRQQAAQAAADAMNGTLAYKPGEVVQINDGETSVQATIVGPAVDAKSGMPIDGQISVQFPDGRRAVFTKEQLQALADAANLERLNSFEQERNSARAQQRASEAEAKRPKFALNDEFTILSETGEPIRGSITGELDDDGKVEIYTEEPINGKKMNRFTPAELEDMFDTYNGEPIATTVAVPENSETVPNSTENPEIGIKNSVNSTETVPKPEGTSTEQQRAALSRIPVDEQGQPKYDEADADTAWDAIVEQAQGDEAIAAEVVADILADREEDFKAAEKAYNKTKEGKPEKRKKDDPAPTMAERIAAKTAAKEALAEVQAVRDKAKAVLDHWKKIAGTVQRRKAAEDAAIKAEAEAKAKAEAEDMRREKERVAKLKRDAGVKYQPLIDMLEKYSNDEEVTAILTDTAPHSADEVAALLLKNNKVLWDDVVGNNGTVLKKGVKSETGIKEDERKRLFGLFASAENGGIGIQALAEDMAKSICEDYGIAYDDQEMRSALIDVIRTATSRGDIDNYIARSRVSQAEAFISDRERHEDEEREAWSQEQFHMSYEDWQAYEDRQLEIIKEIYDNVDETELNNYIADQIIQENDNRRNEEVGGHDDAARKGPSDGRGDKVLHQPQTVSAGRTSGTENGPDSSAQVGNEGADQEGRLREGAPAEVSCELSNEVNEFGKPFVKSSDGTIDFGFIDEESELEPLPIRLSLGENYRDEKNEDHGYGYLHIEAGHRDEILQNGFSSIEEFVESVARNYTDIRIGAKIGNNQTYLLEVVDEHNNTLFIQLSRDGKYWNVNSAGIFKKKYSRRKPKVYSKPAVGDGTVTDTTEVNSGRNDGATAPAGNSSETSDGKVNASSSEKQEDDENSSIQQQIASAESEVNINPTEAQKAAGNYKKGHVKIGAFDVTIEQPVGSVRRGTDANGKEWETTMQNTYGYIRGTKGVDGDHIDVFLSTDLDAWDGQSVVVVDQYNPDGSFDEHKVMLGFNEKADAINAYLANYEKGWEKGRRLVFSTATLEDFEKWIESSRRKQKPYHEYKIADKAEVNDVRSGEKIEDFGEKIAGARKDMLASLSREFGNLTERALVELPLSKAVKRPDFNKAVESGVMTREEAQVAEALWQTVYMSKKPAATRRNATEIKSWASKTYAKIKRLQEYVEADEAHRQQVASSLQSIGAADAAGEQAEFERIERLNPGRDFNEPVFTPDEGAVALEVMRRIGVAPDEKVTIPFRIIVSRTKQYYELVSANGERTMMPATRDLNEAVEWITIAARMHRGNSDIVYPEACFRVYGEKPIYKASGVYEVGWLGGRHGYDYKSKDFNTKKEAEDYAASLKEKGTESRIHEKQAPTGEYEEYRIKYIDPISREPMPLESIYTSKVDAHTAIAERVEALSAEVNEANAKAKGSKPQAKEHFFVTAVYSNRTRKYAVSRNNVGQQDYKNNPIVKEFDTRAEAVEWFEANKDALEKDYADYLKKRREFVYFDQNASPRAGEDYRHGKDVTPEQFSEAFGFRGVQFGNWTNDKDRQAALNEAYDSFMDLAHVTGLSPKAMSLNGELGLSFGARGSGAANAHYEPDEVVINLTKTRGAGSLAHEWWHALDNYLLRKEGVAYGYATTMTATNIRPELSEAFKALARAINVSEFGRRSDLKGEYWGRMIEKTARLFGEWVVLKLEREQRSNHFLSRGVKPSAIDMYKELGYLYHREQCKLKGVEPMDREEFKKTPEALMDFPYPTPEELEALDKNVQAVFDNIEQEESYAGIILGERGGMYERRRMRRSVNAGVSTKNLFDFDFEEEVKTDVEADLINGRIDEYGRQLAEFLTIPEELVTEETEDAIYAERKALKRDLMKYYQGHGSTVEEAGTRANELLAKVQAQVSVRTIHKADSQRFMPDHKPMTDDSYTTAGGEVIRFEGSTGLLPKLEDGEYSLVERRFAINGGFDFSGKTRIESCDDVAFIFRTLESYGTEQAFGVLVKDSKPMIVHLGSGSAISTAVDISPLRVANDVLGGADDIYLVHNHPSGALRTSQADVNLQRRLELMFPGYVRDGIIMDTTRGIYGTFDNSGETTERKRADYDGAVSELPVHSFSRQVFADDFDFDSLSTIASSKDVAAIVAGQRLGTGDKTGILLLNNANKVVGNILCSQAVGSEELPQQIADYALSGGATRVIIYGRASNDSEALRKLKHAVENLSGKGVVLLDSINIKNQGKYESAADNGMFELGAEYGMARREESIDEIISPEDMAKLGEEDRAALEEYLTKMPSARIRVLSSEEIKMQTELSDGAKAELLALANDNETLAGYCRENKKIYIFVDRSGRKTGSFTLQSILIHENAHALADANEEVNIEFLSRFTEAVERMPSRFFKSIRGNLLECGYAEKELNEEIFAYTLQRLFQKPKTIERLKSELGASDRDIFDKILAQQYNGKERYREIHISGFKHTTGETAQRVGNGLEEEGAVGNTGYGSENGKTGEVLGRDGGRGADGFGTDGIVDRQGDGYGAYSDAEVSYLNDPASKVLGKNRFGKKRQAEYAARERRRMAARIEELAGRMHLDNVEVLTDGTGLEGKRATAKGFYNRRTGKITIVLANNYSTIDAEQTLLHEAVAHYGLRRLFGKQFDTFLDNVYESADEEIRRKIAEMTARNGWDFRTATEEYLAGLAEDTYFEKAQSYDGWWSKIKRLFLDMLEKVGFEGFRDKTGVVLTDNELRYILWRSYENLTEPGRYRSILGEAADVAKQAELKVGNYVPTSWDIATAGERTTTELTNDIFNEQLQEQIDGTLPKGHIYQLGKPGSALLSTGVPDLPIQMSATRLQSKATEYGHDFDLSEIRDLVKALQDPMAVFAYGNKDKMQNIIVGIESGGKQFIVGLSLNPVINGKALEINSVRNVFPKDNAEWLNWISQGKLLYVDKQKIQALIGKQRTILADVDYLNLDDVTKVVRSFENPTNSEEESLLFRGTDGSARAEYDERVRTKIVDKAKMKKVTTNRAAQWNEAYLDSMRSLKILQEAVGHETGEPIKDFENTYMAENRMSSRNKIEEEVYERDFFKPMCDAVASICKGNDENYRELLDYIMAKHGLERNAYMRQKAVENGMEQIEADNTDYSGLTALTENPNIAEAEQAAEQMVDNYEANHDTTVLWERINAATSETLRVRYQGGLLSKEMYDKIKSQYKYYLPLKGWNETTAIDVYEYAAGGHKLNSALMRAFGRTSMADDPLVTIMVDAQRTIMEANRNVMKQHFLNMALNHQTNLLTISKQWYVEQADGTWLPDKGPTIPKDADADIVDDLVKQHEAEMLSLQKEGKAKTRRGGLALSVISTNADTNQHVVKVKRNGETFCIYINGDPRAARAINGMLNPDSSEKSDIAKLAQNVKNFMSKSFTTWNPEFVVGNLARDVMFAGTAVAVKEDKAYVKNYTKNISLMLVKARLPRLLYKWESGTLDSTNEIERLFKEFLMNGGETGFTQLNTVDKAKRDMRRFLREAQGGASGISKKAWRGFWGGVEFLNRSAEDTTRFAVYMTSRQQGRSVARSIYDAKEITVNFNKKGSGAWGAQYLNFAYVFFNAALQAIANAGRLVYRNPGKVSIAMAAFMSSGFLLPLASSILAGLFGGDDDDYWNIPEWVRRNNLVIYIPLTNKYLTIPIAHELRPFYGIGEIAYSIISGKETVEDGLWKAVEGFTGLLPIDYTGNGGNQVVNFSPTFAQPIVQAGFNVDYFGKPIYKETPWNADEPEWTKAYKGTNGLLVDLTRMLSEAGSTTDEYDVVDYPKHWYTGDVNPAVVEHLIESYTGGLGKTVNGLAKTISMLWNEDARELRNVPVLRKFIQSSDVRAEERRFSNEYFKLKDEYEESKNYIRKLGKLDEEGAFGVADRVNRWLEKEESGKRYELLDEYFRDIRRLEREMAKENSDSMISLYKQDIDSVRRRLVEVSDSVSSREARKRE